jgi:hypothetical protein
MMSKRRPTVGQMLEILGQVQSGLEDIMLSAKAAPLTRLVFLGTDPAYKTDCQTSDARLAPLKEKLKNYRARLCLDACH